MVKKPLMNMKAEMLRILNQSEGKNQLGPMLLSTRTKSTTNTNLKRDRPSCVFGPTFMPLNFCTSVLDPKSQTLMSVLKNKSVHCGSLMKVRVVSLVVPGSTMKVTVKFKNRAVSGIH